MKKSTETSHFSQEILYSLSEIGSQNKPMKNLLDELLNCSRDFFVVDNLAIYLLEDDSKRVDVIYAKAFGRGKAGEADVSWGVTVGNQVIQEKGSVYDEPAQIDTNDRLNSPFTLGLPLRTSAAINGAIVFIRFGGPRFTPEETNFAVYLSHQVEGILQKNLLQECSEKISKQTSMTELQQNFINTISHELRNPLGFIKGYTTTLLREDAQWDSNTQNEFLRIIERETNHLQELIDNLLDSSRLQSGQMRFDTQIVGIDSLIGDEVKRALINNPDLIFHLDFDPNLQSILGDPDRLAQVFDNLINNSIKYAPGAEIFIAVHQERSRVKIDFRDMGPGISEQFLGLIFNRFFRNPNQSLKIHGSGLGLSICKEIIEHHSGQIIASSPPGSGLSFTIYLPSISRTPETFQSEIK